MRKYKVEYFKKANELGYDCEYSISALESEVGSNNQQNYVDYISNLIDEDMAVYKYPLIVEKDLKKDFGQYWDNLSSFTRNVLVTGITSLITFINCEEKNKELSLDYSSVIISVSRGLERELKDIFFNKFKLYLEKNAVDPSEYKRLERFTYNDENGLKYTQSDFWFTLGKFKFIVNEHNSKNKRGEDFTTIDYHLKQFCDYIFKVDSFSNNSFYRMIEIIDYMIELAKQVDDIANNYRNEAAHTNNISSLDRAKTCVDWIIKVKKLLLKLIEKIDYSKLNLI